MSSTTWKHKIQALYVVSQKRVHWTKPKVNDHANEIADAAERLTIPLNLLLRAVHDGSQIHLEPALWKKLDDNSFKVKDWNPKSKEWKEKIETGQQLIAPIIVQESNSYSVVSGHDILLACKLLNEEPEVWVVKPL